MKRILSILAVVFLALAPIVISHGQERDFDQPKEEEDLNRELWEFARKTPYEEMLAYVRAAQAAAIPTIWNRFPTAIERWPKIFRC